VCFDVAVGLISQMVLGPNQHVPDMVQMKLKRPSSLPAAADKCGCKLWQAFLLWALLALLLHSSCAEARTAETVAGGRAQPVRPRGLQAIAPLNPTADGWMQGRATFFNPLSQFINSLRNR